MPPLIVPLYANTRNRLLIEPNLSFFGRYLWATVLRENPVIRTKCSGVKTEGDIGNMVFESKVGSDYYVRSISMYYY